MKYERQQHSPLFIGLQERKRKIEKAAMPHTLQGRAGIIFSFAKEELRPVFRMHKCHGNNFGRASHKSFLQSPHPLAVTFPLYSLH